MNSSSGVGSGVVERASKEISRRIHSLGFKTSSGSSSSSSSNSARNTNKEESSSSSSSAGGDSEAKSKSNKQIDVDKLNGNETNSGGNQVIYDGLSRSDILHCYRPFYGAIIRGSIPVLEY